MEGAAFRQLLESIAAAWNEGDSNTALGCFTDDARYTEPPDTQHYEGRQEPFEFFGGDDPPPMRMAWHTIVFDRDQQMGAAECTYTGTSTYHGVVVIRLRDDLVANRREYQVRSELEWNAFIALNPFRCAAAAMTARACGSDGVSWVRAKDVHLEEMRSPSIGGEKPEFRRSHPTIPSNRGSQRTFDIPSEFRSRSCSR